MNVDRVGTYRVAEAHESEFPDPIDVTESEEIEVGERDTEWDGWLWCVDSAGREGWIPEEYVTRQGDTGTCLADYTATELTVSVGERVVSRGSVAGWQWCETRGGDEGWLPSVKLQKTE
ncbi:SH3 domain-containing protein (plasmid) [Haladaptatus sp. SPP-AMP-3]|uniref:SH3 domain-containing protein n=1 Tax=Haladaptatus sp. SPP-AMP-3 TaxID=3121295 RepID=UPI003C2C1246